MKVSTYAHQAHMYSKHRGSPSDSDDRYEIAFLPGLQVTFTLYTEQWTTTYTSLPFFIITLHHTSCLLAAMLLIVGKS